MERLTLPCAGSLKWYSGLAESILSGKEFAAADTGCMLNRYAIRGNNGEKLLLSVPVEGGRKNLLRLPPGADIPLSEHGGWRRVHRGAICAAYGRSPYFQHYFPMMEQIIIRSRTLKDLSGNFHSLVMRSAFQPDVLESVKKMRCDRAELFKAEHTRCLAETDTGLSIIDSLFRIGPDTIFAAIKPL